LSKSGDGRHDLGVLAHVERRVTGDQRAVAGRARVETGLIGVVAADQQGVEPLLLVLLGHGGDVGPLLGGLEEQLHAGVLHLDDVGQERGLGKAGVAVVHPLVAQAVGQVVEHVLGRHRGGRRVGTDDPDRLDVGGVLRS
jgi:hypothetical protein